MRKPDDDLKIDINELFGGDISSVRESVEEPRHEAAGVETAPAAEPADTKAAERQFQEWMTAREKELELKTQELERRLQELRDQQLQTPPVPAAEVPISSPVLEEVAPPVAEATADSPIDFNAPILPPFLPKTGGAASAAPATGETAPAEANLTSVGELERMQKEYEFLMLYDEFRGIIIHELKDLVGEKKTYKMLERTVELAREKYPEIFRNANWNAAGNLLEDGSLDSQRLIENKSALDATNAKTVFDLALGSLVSMRLQAVEKGLGTGMKNKVRARLYHWINEKIEKESLHHKNVEDLNRLKNFVV